MKKISNHNNFIYLLASLFLLLFSTALESYAQNIYLSIFNQCILVFIFFVATYHLKSDKFWKYTAYLMGFTTASLFVLAGVFQDSYAFDFIHIIIFLVFFISTFALEAKYVLFQEKVDTNIIVGSIVLYILLALIWTFLYLLIMLIIPESFIGLESLPWQKNFSDLYYFSFVTITTLGYGDITPNNPISEFFVLIESVTGVFYMAIVVSSLVSAHLHRLNKN